MMQKAPECEADLDTCDTTVQDGQSGYLYLARTGESDESDDGGEGEG